SATWPQLKIALVDQEVASIFFVLFHPRQTHETRTKTVRVPTKVPTVAADCSRPSHYLHGPDGSMATTRPPSRLIGGIKGNENQAHHTKPCRVRELRGSLSGRKAVQVLLLG